MGSRLILPFGSDNFIEKHIPEDEYLNQWNFPSLDEFYNKGINSIYNHKGKNNSIAWSAVEQQYTEWSNWFNSPEYIRSYLAPIVATYLDKRGLPVLCYPTFTPLLNEELVYKYNDTEALLFAGKQLQILNVSDENILNFFRNILKVINYLDLVEEDILNNPSNIGYNSTFGLRIIDYGMCASVNT